MEENKVNVEEVSEDKKCENCDDTCNCDKEPEKVEGEVEETPIDWKFVAKEALKVAGGALIGYGIGKTIYGRIRYITKELTVDIPPVKDNVNKDCVNAYIHTMNEFFNRNNIVLAKDTTKKLHAALDYIK